MTNKIIIDIIKKNVKDRLKMWHESLQNVIPTIKNSKTVPNGFTPYQLIYDQDKYYY